MNYLGHLYLSDKEPYFLIGGFIADAIKGKKYEIYPKKIQKGILFHRSIDSLTDQNEELRLLKKKLYPAVGKYAGVVLDIYLDHVLAKYWVRFSDIPLNDFSKKAHETLINGLPLMPWVSKYIFIRMFLGSWLTSYEYFEGFESAINGMSYRPRVKRSLLPSVNIIRENKELFEKHSLKFLSYIKEEKLK